MSLEEEKKRNFLIFISDNLEHFDTDEFNNPIPLDDQLLNRVQFSALLLAFLGAEKNESIVCALIDYFRTNYRETPDDKNKKRNLVRIRFIFKFIINRRFEFSVTSTSSRCSTTFSSRWFIRKTQCYMHKIFEDGIVGSFSSTVQRWNSTRTHRAK